MASGRVYTANSALVPFTGTTATPVFCGTATSTAPLDIQAIRIGAYSAASASYPSNGSLLVQLARATGIAAGGTAVTPAPHNSSDIAANTVFKDASGAAITGLTIGAVLWEQSIPFTAGANWAEWVTPGSEWRIPASGVFAVYLTTAVAGTNTDVAVSLTFAE
jgi:hypothetical protein